MPSTWRDTAFTLKVQGSHNHTVTYWRFKKWLNTYTIKVPLAVKCYVLPLNNSTTNLKMISRPFETDVGTMLVPMQESMRPANASNQVAGPEIPAAVIHQFGKHLSTGLYARPWWSHGKEMATAQFRTLSIVLQRKETNVSVWRPGSKKRAKCLRGQRAGPEVQTLGGINERYQCQLRGKMALKG